MAAVLLPDIFRDVMPGTTAGVMQLFAGGDEGLARTLLLAAKASDIYGEPAATSHDLEVRPRTAYRSVLLHFFYNLGVFLLRYARTACARRVSYRLINFLSLACCLLPRPQLLRCDQATCMQPTHVLCSTLI